MSLRNAPNAPNHRMRTTHEALGHNVSAPFVCTADSFAELPPRFGNFRPASCPSIELCLFRLSGAAWPILR
jgi:hypothetical protein